MVCYLFIWLLRLRCLVGYVTILLRLLLRLLRLRFCLRLFDLFVGFIFGYFTLFHGSRLHTFTFPVVVYSWLRFTFYGWLRLRLFTFTFYGLRCRLRLRWLLFDSTFGCGLRLILRYTFPFTFVTHHTCGYHIAHVVTLGYVLVVTRLRLILFGYILVYGLHTFVCCLRLHVYGYIYVLTLV